MNIYLEDSYTNCAMRLKPGHMASNTLYKVLLNSSTKITLLAGHHHGGCLLPILELGLPLTIIIQQAVRQELSPGLLILLLSLSVFFIIFSPVISSPQFWRSLQDSHTQNWQTLLLVQFWFLSLLLVWLTAVGILWHNWWT
jgi:hypothetical protein